MLRVLFFLIVLSSAVMGKSQSMRTTQEQALDTLQKLKELFAKSNNDSLFISKYSDNHYRFYSFTRGDQAEDIEEQIYTTPVGGVAGPFRGDGTTNYLFKVVSFDGYTTRARATLILIKPQNPDKTDSSAIKKLAKKYSDILSKGKNAKEAAEKDKVRLVFSDLKYFYEDQKDKQYYSLVMDGSKGKSYIVNSSHGPAILLITSDREKVAFKVKLIAVVKKG